MRPDNTPKANQRWRCNLTGAIYTVLSNKAAWKPGRNGRRFYEVTAWTHDPAQLLDGEGSNGRINGRPAHVVFVDEWRFVEGWRVQP